MPGPARARFDDYIGTAAADDADALLHTRSLYEIANLERERWAIVGVDLVRWDTSPRLTVYAMDRNAARPSDQADLDEEVAVTAFHLAGADEVERFVSEASKRLSIRLVARSVHDKQLVVAADADLGLRVTHGSAH